MQVPHTLSVSLPLHSPVYVYGICVWVATCMCEDLDMYASKSHECGALWLYTWRQWIRHDSIDQLSFKNLMRHRQVRHRKKFTSLLYLRSACKCHGISRMNGPVHSWCVAMHPEQRFWSVRLETSHAPHATKSRRGLGDTCLLPCLQENDTSHTISHKCRVVWLPTLLQWIQHDVIDCCVCK